MKAGRRIELMPLSKIKAAKNNPKDHDLDTISSSMARFGFGEAPMVDDRTGRLVAGHGRLEALKAMKKEKQKPPTGVTTVNGDWMVPVQRGWASKDDADANAYLIASNRLVELGGWDEEARNALLIELSKAGEAALLGVGFDMADIDSLLRAAKDASLTTGVKLSDRFLVPPFSVLDARQGYWQERKREWLAMGIESEVGRGLNLLKYSDTVQMKKSMGVYAAPHGVLKRGALNKNESDRQASPGGGQTGTSVFDPVLCELIYRWFARTGFKVLDPFAGGSVRGIVAAKLGLQYHGIELRKEQVEANYAQANKIFGKKESKAITWEQGDSRVALKFAKKETADLVFSCPPYGSLERYSDDPNDLSTMAPEVFDAAIHEIVGHAVDCLKPNRFACFVVGDYRDEEGFCRNFPLKVINAFEEAGAKLYNEVVLVTAVGTLAMRVGSFFPKARKLGKTHQNVLVFFKGDVSKISEELGVLEIPPETLKLIQETEGEIP